MEMIEALKQEFKNFLREVKEKTNKKKESEEISKSLKENPEKAIKQMKEMAQNLETEIEVIKEHKLREFWKWKIWVNNQEPQMQA